MIHCLIYQDTYCKLRQTNSCSSANSEVVREKFVGTSSEEQKVNPKVSPQIKIVSPPKDYIFDEMSYEFRSREFAKIHEDREKIMGILSNLKLGMNLSSVSFPTSILQPYSLLESLADMFSFPTLILKIMNAKSETDKIKSSMEFLVGAFHGVFGNDPPAKKPYNPVLGETFSCLYKFKDENWVDFLKKNNYLSNLRDFYGSNQI